MTHLKYCKQQPLCCVHTIQHYMTLAQHLKLLILQLQHHLTELQDELIIDLKNLQTNKALQYVDDYTFDDIACFCFEYEYDYLDIVGWAMNAHQEVITGTVVLPSKNQLQEKKNRWAYLLPESVYDAQIELQDQYSDEEDEWDKYHNQKDQTLTVWFRDSWLKVSKETGTKSDAYFSIHDTYWRTDLKTGRKLNDDEIAKRYL